MLYWKATPDPFLACIIWSTENTKYTKRREKGKEGKESLVVTAEA